MYRVWVVWQVFCEGVFLWILRTVYENFNPYMVCSIIKNDMYITADSYH